MTKRGKSSDVEGKPFGRGNLYHLLSNPIYVGKVGHRDQVYEGEHQLIIDDDVFAGAYAVADHPEAAFLRREAANAESASGPP